MANHCAEYHLPLDANGVTIPLSHESISHHVLSQAWSYLQRQGITPRWGDLVFFDSLIGYRNEGVVISDGRKLRELDYSVDEYGALPSEYTVLEGGRAVDYWASSPPTFHGIGHNSIVWYPYWNHLKELKSNISFCFEAAEGQYVMSSTFTYQDSKQKLIYDYVDYAYDYYNKKPTWTDASLTVDEQEEIKAKFLTDLEAKSELYYQGEYSFEALYLRPSA